MPGCCSWPTPAPTPASTTSARTASCTSLRPAPDRVFVLQSAGSLATTHEVLARIDRDLRHRRRPREPGDRRAPLRGRPLRRSPEPRGRRVAPRRAERRRGRRHGHVHPRWTDRRRPSGHPPRVPGGQLHPHVRHRAVPADRRAQVRQVPARARRAGPRRPADRRQDRPRLDAQHGPRQPVGRTALRRGDLPQRLAGGPASCASRRTTRTSPSSTGSGPASCSTASTTSRRSRPTCSRSWPRRPPSAGADELLGEELQGGDGERRHVGEAVVRARQHVAASPPVGRRRRPRHARRGRRNGCPSARRLRLHRCPTWRRDERRPTGRGSWRTPPSRHVGRAVPGRRRSGTPGSPPRCR